MPSLLRHALVLAIAIATTGACTHRQQVNRAEMAVLVAEDGDLTSGADFSRPSAPERVPLRYERRSHLRGMLDGLGVGVLLGAATGTVLGLAAGDDTACSLLCFTAGEKAAYAGTFLGMLGGAAGTVVGGIQGAEMIYHLRHEADVTVEFATAGRSVSAGWSTEF